MECRDEIRRGTRITLLIFSSDQDVVRAVESGDSGFLPPSNYASLVTENLSLPHLAPSPCLTSLEHRLQEEEWKPVEAFILTAYYIVDRNFEPAKPSSQKSAKPRN